MSCRKKYQCELFLYLKEFYVRLKEKKRSDSSKSSASHLADVVSGIVTAHVVPLVIPRLKQFDRFNNHHHDDYVVTTYNGEERVVLFPKCEAHLVVLVVVRLTVGQSNLTIIIMIVCDVHLDPSNIQHST